MITERIKPDVAIVTDVCHDTQTPMINKIKQGDLFCGKGPVLTYGPAVQNNLLNLIIDTAIKIKYHFKEQQHHEQQVQILMLLHTQLVVLPQLLISCH